MVGLDDIRLLDKLTFLTFSQVKKWTYICQFEHANEQILTDVISFYLNPNSYCKLPSLPSFPCMSTLQYAQNRTHLLSLQCLSLHWPGFGSHSYYFASL